MEETAWRALACTWLMGCTLVQPLDDLGSGPASSSALHAASTAASGGAQPMSSAGGGGAPGSGGGGGSVTGCSYPDEVLADAPLGYWRLGETSGTAAVDASGHGHHGQYVGAGLGVAGALGDDGAVHVEGGGLVELGDNFDFPGTAPFSLEAWVLPDPLADGAVMGKLGDSSTHRGYLVNVKPDSIVFRRAPDGVASAAMAFPPSYVHVVATYDGSYMRVYVNGVPEVSEAHLGALDEVPQMFLIGDAYNWGSYEGAVDEVAVYAGALSSARIQAHYQCATQGRL